MRKAAFFDRDGTINVNTGHLYEPEKLVFIEGVPQLIRKFNEEMCIRDRCREVQNCFRPKKLPKIMNGFLSEKQNRPSRKYLLSRSRHPFFDGC